MREVALNDKLSTSQKQDLRNWETKAVDTTKVIRQVKVSKQQQSNQYCSTDVTLLYVVTQKEMRGSKVPGWLMILSLIFHVKLLVMDQLSSLWPILPVSRHVTGKDGCWRADWWHHFNSVLRHVSNSCHSDRYTIQKAWTEVGECVVIESELHSFIGYYKSKVITASLAFGVAWYYSSSLVHYLALSPAHSTSSTTFDVAISKGSQLSQQPAASYCI